MKSGFVQYINDANDAAFGLLFGEQVKKMTLDK